MDVFSQIAIKIIKEQELVIGPLAWEEAEQVQGIKIIDRKTGEVQLTNGDPKQVVNRLVNQYERLFGRASHEVCKDAARALVADLSPSDIPTSLK